MYLTFLNLNRSVHTESSYQSLSLGEVTVGNDDEEGDEGEDNEDHGALHPEWFCVEDENVNRETN